VKKTKVKGEGVQEDLDVICQKLTYVSKVRIHLRDKIGKYYGSVKSYSGNMPASGPLKGYRMSTNISSAPNF